VNCAECQQSATVYSGGVPLCGTCFYKRSVDAPPAGAPEPVRQDVWRRLSDAIVALETLVAKIGGEIDELMKQGKV
jgi:hypothetical protein